MSDLVSIDAYRRTIVRLTSENKELKQRLADMQAQHASEVRALKAQLNEGLTPELTVLRRELSRANSRTDAAERRLSQALRREAS